MTILEMSGPPYGNYDQCLSIESPAEVNQLVIRGKYCYLGTGIINSLRKDVQRMNIHLIK